jgi:hypothetical protein
LAHRAGRTVTIADGLIVGDTQRGNGGMVNITAQG